VVGQVAAGEVKGVHVVVERGGRLVDDQPAVARRPAGDREPAIALVHQLGVAAGRVPILYVYVEHRLIAAVRGERKAVALAVPAAPPMFRLRAIGEVGDLARLIVEQV